MAPTSKKLSSLQTSTLSLLLERQRSISLSLAPSPSTESTILRNFGLLNDGIEAIFLEGDEDEEEWKKLDQGLERLVAMWEEGGGEEAKTKARRIREGMRSVVPEHGFSSDSSLS